MPCTLAEDDGRVTISDWWRSSLDATITDSVVGVVLLGELTCDPGMASLFLFVFLVLVVIVAIRSILAGSIGGAIFAIGLYAALVLVTNSIC